MFMVFAQHCSGICSPHGTGATSVSWLLVSVSYSSPVSLSKISCADATSSRTFPVNSRSCITGAWNLGSILCARVSTF
jgi:hypothetical protein